MINTDNAIYSEQAYIDGAIARIIANATKTFWKTYPRGQEVAQFLARYDEHSKDSFLKTMALSYRKYGKLTEKQYQCVCDAIDRFAELKVKRDAEIAEQKAKSQHLGVASEKIELTVIVEKILEIDAPKFSRYDRDYADLYLMKDEAGNRIVLKTKAYYNQINEGDTLKIKAVIKAHTEYKGEKQTIIQRMKLVEKLS